MVNSAQPKKVTERIKKKALELLQAHPEGLHYKDLRNKIKESDVPFNSSTINNSITHLDADYSDKVYKPSRGFFRLVAFADQELENLVSPVAELASPDFKEEAFYTPFAEWLKNEIEDVTHAIALGSGAFKDKWGTPSVIGKKESGHSDIVKGITEIVAAEIKTATYHLITAFGHACAYKLFCHKAYLVIPQQTHGDDISRMESLCQIFGIGLVTFNVADPSEPDFRMIVRPSRNEPDLFYTNKYMAVIEKELFA